MSLLHILSPTSSADDPAVREHINNDIAYSHRVMMILLFLTAVIGSGFASLPYNSWGFGLVGSIIILAFAKLSIVLCKQSA